MKVRLKDDYIKNTETGETKYVVTKTDNPVDMKDLVMGGLSIFFGIYCLVKSAYKNGCKDYNEAEFRTLDDLGLIRKNENGKNEIG